MRARPLQRTTFAQRLAFPGAPVVWCVVCVQRVTGTWQCNTPPSVWGVLLALSYVGAAVWWGSLRELEAQGTLAAAGYAARIANTLADLGVAVCFLYFVLNWDTWGIFFMPVFFATGMAHLVVENIVSQRLQTLQAHHGKWRPGFRDQEEDFNHEPAFWKADESARDDP